MAQVSRTVPERMRAIAIDRFGGPEVLTMHTLPVPVPGSSRGLIAVAHRRRDGGHGSLCIVNTSGPPKAVDCDRSHLSGTCVRPSIPSLSPRSPAIKYDLSLLGRA